MNLAALFAFFLLISGLGTFAWAAGLAPATLLSWPWIEVALIALPILAIAAARRRLR
ncbi:MAG: hypothetical protein V2I43_28615 [Parvularcula sp.]|jgi:hypothetical protein|nr:hypothetical protein [Parvularcula sp.]